MSIFRTRERLGPASETSQASGDLRESAVNLLWIASKIFFLWDLPTFVTFIARHKQLGWPTKQYHVPLAKLAYFPFILVHYVRSIPSSIGSMIVDWQLNSQRRSILIWPLDPSKNSRVLSKVWPRSKHQLAYTVDEVLQVVSLCAVFASVMSDWSKTSFI